MLTSILRADNAPNQTFASNFAKILSKIDYGKLARVMKKVDEETSKTHVVVLMEYVNSTCDATIAEIERIPETTIPIETFLNDLHTKCVLQNLFVSAPHMSIYTRRKIDHSKVGTPETTTKYKQLVLRIPPSAPSPVLHAEVTDTYAELNIAHIEL